MSIFNYKINTPICSQSLKVHFISVLKFIGVNEIKQHYFLVCGEREIKIRFFLKWVINSPCVKKKQQKKKGKNNKKRKVCVKKMNNNNKTTETLGNRTFLEITG